MKKTRLTYATGIVVGLAFLSACDDEVTNVTQKVGLDTVAKYKDLDKCEKNDVGILVYVSDSAQVYTCTEDGWISTNGTDGKDGAKGAAGKDGASCSVKALRSGDGYKVICNGDSIGVLLNGQDGTGSTGKNGEKGASEEDGASCSIEDDNNGTVKVTCGTTSTTIYKALCGSTPYDPARMLCTNDEVTGLPTTYPVGTMRSCSSVTYDPSKQLCVNGTLVDIGDGGVTSFCGSSPYNPENQACLDGSFAYLGKGKLPSYGFYCSYSDLWCKNESDYLDRVKIVGSTAEDAGRWFFYNDNEKGGRSTVYWPVSLGNEYSAEALDPMVNHCKGLCGTIELDKSRVLNPFFGMGFLVGGKKDGGDPEQVDMSGWGGLCVTYSSMLPASIIMDLGKTANAKIDNVLPSVALPVSANIDEKCFAWSQFKQNGLVLGEEVTGDKAAKYLTAIKIEFSATEEDASGYFNIVRLRSWSSASYPSCRGLWCTASEGKVNTGSGVSGYWFDFNDEVDGGNTKLLFPGIDENKYGNFFGPSINVNEGIKGRVLFGDKLNNGAIIRYGGIGFSVANVNALRGENVFSWTGEGSDITSWGGICLTYKSTGAFIIEIVPTAEMNATKGDNYYVRVPSSSNVTMVNYDWTDFKQGNWGEKAYLYDVLSMATSIRFKFQTSDSSPVSPIDFEIKTIGTSGSCSN